ncbi:MAG: tryptophan--tRNA ligase, partial [Amphritea sp.]|nr:tryptophan--tRNA ligase [Amphritea sp.]
RRAILMQLKPLLDRVNSAADKAQEAASLLAEKEQQVAGLKKKAKQKAQNELDLLREELAGLLD